MNEWEKNEIPELTDIEQQALSIIWQAFPQYFDGAVEGQNYADAENLERLVRDLSKHFVEQACAIADKQITVPIDRNLFKQALRDKFK